MAKPERLVTQVGGRINRRWDPPPAPGAHFSTALRTRSVTVWLPHAQKQRAGLGQPPGQTPWGSGCSMGAVATGVAAAV